MRCLRARCLIIVQQRTRPHAVSVHPVFFPLLFAARRPKILEIKPRASAFVDGSQWIRSLGVITRPDESQILHSPGLTFRITLIFPRASASPKKQPGFWPLKENTPVRWEPPEGDSTGLCRSPNGARDAGRLLATSLVPPAYSSLGRHSLGQC